MRLAVPGIIATFILVGMSRSSPEGLQANGSANDQQATVGKIAWQYDTAG